MKLICDCGNIEEFILPEPEERFNADGAEHRDKKFESFDINAGYDEVFISCNKCGKDIHVYA